MFNPIIYLRDWFDGEGIEHEDFDKIYEGMEIYNLKFMGVAGVFSVSWGHFKNKLPITYGYPECVEGVYMDDLDYDSGVQPQPFSVEDIKEMAINARDYQRRLTDDGRD